MGTALNIVLQDEFADIVNTLAAQRNKSAVDVVKEAVTAYLAELEEQLDAEEAVRILEDSATEIISWEEAKKELNLA